MIMHGWKLCFGYNNTTINNDNAWSYLGGGFRVQTPVKDYVHVISLEMNINMPQIDGNPPKSKTPIKFFL